MQDLVQRFGRWEPAAVGADDLVNLDLLLSVRRDYLGEAPAHWHAGDIELLLLEVFPRKVQCDPSLQQDGPAVLGRFLRFLAQTDRLSCDGIVVLEAELAEVAPEFAGAMNDRTRFGMAKSLFGALSADDLDLDNPKNMQAAIDALNARPYAERMALLAGNTPSGDASAGLLPEAPLVLPPVSLADEAELRRLAGGAPLVVRIGKLMSYVGPNGRPVTQTGALRLADATALAEFCGDGDRLHGPAPWGRPVRRMADLPGVNEAYEMACDAGLLDQVGSRVRRAPGAPGSTDVLERAEVLAELVLFDELSLDDSPAHLADVAEAVGDALPGLLALLYAQAEPLPLDVLSQELAEELGVAAGGPFADRTSIVRVCLERAFERFERLAMVQRLGVQFAPGGRRLSVPGGRATSVALTPLGVWWLQRVLPSHGVRAPLIGELASATARELCVGLHGYSEPAGRAEIDAWRAARGAAEAARQMAELLADPDVTCRQVAVTLLDDLPGAADAVRPLLDQPAARPYAKLWLESTGEQVPVQSQQPDDDLLLFVDTFGLLIETGHAPDLLEQLAGMGDQPAQVDLVRRMWRIESPYTELVLQTIASGAPAAISKAARKALFSLRSAGRTR